MTPYEAQAEAFASLRATIEDVMVNDQREDEVLALLDDFEMELTALRAGLVDRRQQFRRLNADYDTTPDELSAFVDAIEVRLAADRLRFVEARNKLIESTTPEQWAAISKVEMKSMQALVDSLLLL